MLHKKIWMLFGLFLVTANSLANSIDNPCGGPSELLNLVDRPSAADNACAVPFNKAILESGYQYQKLAQPGGSQQNFTQSELRLGLPASNELYVIFPNAIHQSRMPRSGSSATSIGLKHQIGYTENWLAAVESVVTLPSGSNAFGSDGTGTAFNGIVNYTINPVLGLSFMFGVTSQTDPTLTGGERFTSFNPDLVLTYIINPKFYVYGEVYGQSKTGPTENRGFNADAGIMYLIKPNIEIDMVIGHRINGQLAGLNQYIGAGFSVMF